jgi:pilus assembly protein CpaC
MRGIREIGTVVMALVGLATTMRALDVIAPKSMDLAVTVGKGVVVDCPNGIIRVATSSPEVVDLVTASGREVLLHAKALGQATLFIWSKTGERTVYEVTVEPNLEPLRRLVRETFPDEQIDLRATRDSLALIGKASTQAVADRALALVTASVKGAISNLTVTPPAVEKQIVLHVRFAELNRTAVEEFGVNILSTGAANTPGRITTGQFGSGIMPALTGTIGAGAAGARSTFSLSDMLNIFAFRPDLNLGVLIKDLQSRGLLQILAEPNLVATNGKEASFLAGGEFPIPVQQSGANAGGITVMFREYGIRLSFLPNVTTHNTIRLHVKPEVSTIDAANGVNVSGLSIPALSTRRMETDVELGEGQSFVIGGLIDDRVIENLSQVPGLAHIPVLGALFKSRSTTKTKTELVVVVTPEVAVLPPRPAALPNMPIPFMPSPEDEKKAKPE